MGLFGPAFVEGAPALSILVLGRLVTSWTGPVGSLLNVTGHQAYSVYTYSAAALLQVALLLALVPWHGIVGAAIASTLAMVAWNVVLAILVVRKLRIRLWPLPTKAIHHD
jgi:O-antigen/teichoic acid export membrane protein